MCFRILQTLLCYIIVCVIAFEDIIYVYGQVSQEMVEQGRRQYQLLQERGNLPHYGNCWKSAVEHIEEGCRDLSEETQSDMALHLTNCFLEMSGHETYNCELDKKPNLKGICMRSMTDRAFNAYTEFYTHTQNICWFLQGQVWHETIAENTLRVGKQLEKSASNQEQILKSQEESLKLQEKLLNHGKNLEKVMDDFYVSTKQHQEVLMVMSSSLRNLQSWLVGEISWFDLIMFYFAAVILIMVVTSSQRTAAARLPIWILLILNAVMERIICSVLILNYDSEAHLIHDEIYKYIWWSRKIFIALTICVLVYKAYSFKDMSYVNHSLLQRIYDQNLKITERLDKMQNKNNSVNLTNGHLSFENEHSFKRSFDDSTNFNANLNGICKPNNYLRETIQTHKKTVLTNGDIDIFKDNFNFHKTEGRSTPNMSPNANMRDSVAFNKTISGRQRISPYTDLQSGSKYNLRSRNGTPNSNF